MVGSNIVNYLWDNYERIWLLRRIESYVMYVRVGKTYD